MHDSALYNRGRVHLTMPWYSREYILLHRLFWTADWGPEHRLIVGYEQRWMLGAEAYASKYTQETWLVRASHRTAPHRTHVGLHAAARASWRTCCATAMLSRSSADR